MLHRFAGGSAVPLRDAGAGSCPGVATGGAYVDPAGAVLFPSQGSCVSVPAWHAVDESFTVLVRFRAPPAPAPPLYTVWEAGTQPNVARLYVSQGALTLTYGRASATGGAAVAPGSACQALVSCAGGPYGACTVESAAL